MSPHSFLVHHTNYIPSNQFIPVFYRSLTMTRSTRSKYFADAANFRFSTVSSSDQIEQKPSSTKIPKMLKPHPVAKLTGRKRKSSENVTAPDNWEKVYDEIRLMRKNIVAPVDTMGSDSHTHKDPKLGRFHVLISLMLSSQTKDTINAVVMDRLKERGLTVQWILDIPEAELDEIIHPVGFHRRKAGYIKRAAIILREKYDDDVPPTLEKAMELPGVGPKMGVLLMHSAWNQNIGIGVDVHVHRISNLLGWVSTNTPEKTRMCLQSWLPPDRWQEINHLLVGFGQVICLPRGRKCEECRLSNGLCPSVSFSPKKTRRAGTGKQIDRVTEEKIKIELPDVEDLAKVI